MRPVASRKQARKPSVLLHDSDDHCRDALPLRGVPIPAILTFNDEESGEKADAGTKAAMVLGALRARAVPLELRGDARLLASGHLNGGTPGAAPPTWGSPL